MRKIWLIGFRGAGKTTVAERLGLSMVDTDQELERRMGSSIRAFVEKNGLDAFRREEEKLLRELESKNEIVVATGGGYVDWEPSRAIVARAAGEKVYLDLPVDELWDRLQKTPERLEVMNLSSLEEFRTLWEKRRQFYEKIASIVWKKQDISECLALLKNLWERPR